MHSVEGQNRVARFAYDDVSLTELFVIGVVVESVVGAPGPKTHKTQKRGTPDLLGMFRREEAQGDSLDEWGRQGELPSTRITSMDQDIN